MKKRKRPNHGDGGRDTRAEIDGFIGEGTRMAGDLTLNGGFRIDGTVSGKVTSPSTLIVGPPGEVEADELRAGSLLVSGTVRGTIHVEDRLEVHPGGQVHGEVTMASAGLVISPGGRFEGTIKMNADDRSEAPEAEPEEV
jgi:cytoskeletal protein CcmA (bactofilin family)